MIEVERTDRQVGVGLWIAVMTSGDVMTEADMVIGETAGCPPVACGYLPMGWEIPP